MRKVELIGSIRSAAILALMLGACELGTPVRVSAPADSAAGEVAFRMAAPNEAVVLVPVQINGRGPVDFALDTGATITCIDVSLARELGLPAERGLGGIALGAASPARMETVRVDSLRVGNAVVRDLIACQLDLAQLRSVFGASGLLGLNFLKSFDVAIDFQRSVLRLQRTE